MATLLILSQLFDDTYSDILNTDFSLILAACSTTILTLCLAFPMIKVFIKKQRNLPIKVLDTNYTLSFSNYINCCYY